jgi:hypothetical protein
MLVLPYSYRAILFHFAFFVVERFVQIIEKEIRSRREGGKKETEKKKKKVIKKKKKVKKKKEGQKTK